MPWAHRVEIVLLVAGKGVVGNNVWICTSINGDTSTIRCCIAIELVVGDGVAGAVYINRATSAFIFTAGDVAGEGVVGDCVIVVDINCTTMDIIYAVVDSLVAGEYVVGDGVEFSLLVFC